MTYTDLRPTYEDPALWTLGHVLRDRARRRPDHPYLVAPDEGISYTYAETLGLAERVASGLAGLGAAPGDRLLIMSPNRADYVLAWFGTALAGMAEVPLNTAYRGTFLAHQVGTVQPRFAVIAPEQPERFLEIPDAAASLERFLLFDGPGADQAAARLTGAGWSTGRFADLLSAPTASLPEPDPTDLAAVFFTSGTTGLSKGVMVPHAQMHFFADEAVSLTRLGEDDVYLACGPLFHANAQVLAAYPALIAGGTFVLRRHFSASQWASWLREDGATVTNLLGVMMDFVHKQEPGATDADNRLRCVFAVPTASSIQEAFAARFGVEAFVECFGMTETSLPILTPYGAPRPPGAAGQLVDDWFDARLVDPDTDREVAVGEVGELVVRPRVPFTTCLGYFGMPEQTVAATRNLWFHTGDALRRDAEGWYYFVDRLKDAIRRRGENISSYEVEQALLTHPAVVECAVIAVPADVEGGEDEVMAFLVPAEGRTLDPRAVWSWCDDALPAFMVPRYLCVTGELPKTPTEKVRKAELRRIAPEVERNDRTVAGQPASRG